MKKFILVFIFILAKNFVAQVSQERAPWQKDIEQKNTNKTTLNNVEKSARAYFETIDKNKKGSGLKPFERWSYHWRYYTDSNSVIAPVETLWDAWHQKNSMNENVSRADVSNWTSLGPYSHTNTASWSSGQGRVNAITIDPSNPNTYYVGAPAGGIWKSTDAGINWTPLTDYLPQIGVSGIAVHPSNSNIIYISTGDDDAGSSYSVGVWKSINGGITWNATGNMLGNPSSMNEIYIDPNSPETVLVATNQGVFKTVDGGANWTRKLVANIFDIKMKPNDPSTWYAVSRNSFYKSTDNGETFTSVAITGVSSSSRLVIDVTPADNNIVYMVSAGNSNNFNGVYKSTNSGTSFTRTSETDDIFESTQSWYDLSLTVSDTDPNKVYVGVLNIWNSIDGGNDFSKLNEWNAPNSASYTHADIHFLRFINGNFLAGTDGGIYRSIDHGTNFTDLTENLGISQFYKISVAKQNSNNIVGGLQDNGGYAYSNNNWNNYFGADGMDCAISATTPNTYYGFTQYGGNLYKTIDGGLSRNAGVSAPIAETGSGDRGGEWVTPMVSNNAGEIYAGYSQLYKLNGNVWEKISNHSFGGNLDQIEIDPNNDDNIYVSQSNGLYRSIDKGVNFTKLTFSNGFINSIEIDNNNPNVGWVVINSGVYKSINLLDASPSFTNITGNLPSESKMILRHHQRGTNNTVYLGTALGVYFLDDTSTDWQVYDNNLPNVAVRDLEINERDYKLYAGTYGRGVFVSDLPKILPTNDISLTSVKDYYCGNGTIIPEITVKNQGVEDITEVTVNYAIDAGITSEYLWNGNIASEETIIIVLPAISSDIGKHSLDIETTITNDTYSTNNQIFSNIIINNEVSNPIAINTFELSTDALFTETIDNSATLWTLGVPNNTLLNNAASGTKAYVTNLNGDYLTSSVSYLYTGCYDLTTVSNPNLKFKMGFDIENNWDYLLVEYTTDFGVTWSVLGDAESNWYNSSSTQNGLPGKQWTGEGENSNALGNTNATLHEYSYNLADFTDDSNIVFRFKFFSDSVVTEEGVLIDDLVIEGTILATSNDEFSEESIFIYPNPSKGSFTISSKQINIDIEVFDITGKLVLKHVDLLTNNGFYTLNMSKYSKGLYFLRINSEGNQIIKKIILE